MAEFLLYEILNQPRGKENPNYLTGECVSQLQQYFNGKRKIFNLPLEFSGTGFQKLVWAELLTIPHGKTRSYSEIAGQIDSGPRAVGSANRLNKLPIIVPCHRVIGIDGKLVGYALGLDRKLWLLKHEQGL